MLKRTLQAPPEVGTIAAYASELSQSLRKAVPGERTDQIVTEAEAHLHDQANALVQSENLSRSDAEAQAVAAFTSAKVFARDMAQSSYETRQSKAWRALSSAFVVICFACFLSGIVWEAINDLIFCVPFAALPLVGLFAWNARRAQTRRIVACGAFAALFAFFYTGFFYVGTPTPSGEILTWGNRTSVQAMYEGWHNDRLQVDGDIRRLQRGLLIYRQKNAVVPASLKGPKGHGFIVPNEISPNMIFADTHQKDSCYFYPFWFDAKNTQVTVATTSEARKRWLLTGSRWLALAQYQSHIYEHYEDLLSAALKQTGFAKAAPWYAQQVAVTCAWLIAIDFIFAKWGRAVYAKRRTKRIKGAKCYA